jgi:putative phage-type endonuclease
MKVLKFDSREAWLEARKGKITGTRLKDIIAKKGGGKKIGFYELIAERIAIPADGEFAMDRGTRLEDEAIQRFAQETGKEVDTNLVIWESDEHPDIAISPDGFISHGALGIKEAVEVKCLASARHIEAFLTQQVPDDYYFQALQYFIVCETLQTLYFVLYDPRIPAKDFFFLTLTRETLQEEIDTYLAWERDTLKEVEEIVTALTF